MLDRILQIIAPYYCYGCRKAGAALCDNCKYDIIDEPWNGCVVCGRPSANGICSVCQMSYTRAWLVGERHDSLEQLIDAYKFENAQAVQRDLAKLLDETLPALPSSIVVVPVPTVHSHVRKRGYDQTLLVTKRFAKLRKYKHETPLKRATNTVQRGASKRERIKQAKQAFRVSKLLTGGTYLLIDDIITTGATLQYGALALLDAGADEVFVAAIARQPLSKDGHKK